MRLLVLSPRNVNTFLIGALAAGMLACSPAASAREPVAEGTPRAWTLEDCIAIALENQLAIQAQRSGVGAAGQQERIARSYYMPQASLQLQYTAIDEPRSVDLPNPITGPLADVVSDAAAYFGIARQAGSAAAAAALDHPHLPPFSAAKQSALDALPDRYRVYLLGENILTSQIQLVQPLWTGGKIRHRHEQALLGVNAAQYDLEKTRQETTFNVSRAYLAVVLAEELVSVARDTAGRFRAIENLLRGLSEAENQYVTVADAHRAASLRRLAEANQVGFVRTRERALTALRLAMGLEQYTELLIADRHLAVGRLDLDPDVMVQTALTQRPELAKATVGTEVADLDRKIARADFHPTVAMYGSFSTIHDDRNFANPNDPEEWSAGLTAEVPLGTGGRRMAQVRQAQWRVAQASQHRQLVGQIIAQEVQDAYLEYIQAQERIVLEGEAVHEAMEALAFYDDQLAGGLVRDENMPDYFKDLILARTILTGALASYHQSVYTCNLALARIRLVVASDEYHTFLEHGRAAAARAVDGRRDRAVRSVR